MTHFGDFWHPPPLSMTRLPCQRHGGGVVVGLQGILIWDRRKIYGLYSFLMLPISNNTSSRFFFIKMLASMLKRTRPASYVVYVRYEGIKRTCGETSTYGKVWFHVWCRKRYFHGRLWLKIGLDYGCLTANKRPATHTKANALWTNKPYPIIIPAFYQ